MGERNFVIGDFAECGNWGPCPCGCPMCEEVFGMTDGKTRPVEKWMDTVDEGIYNAMFNTSLEKIWKECRHMQDVEKTCKGCRYLGFCESLAALGTKRRMSPYNWNEAVDW